MPSSVQGNERKLARPYCVLKVTSTNVQVTLVYQPRDQAIYIVEFDVATTKRKIDLGQVPQGNAEKVTT